MDDSDVEIVYSSEPTTYQESIQELIRLFERKMEQNGWGDDQHPNGTIATVNVAHMGNDTDAFGVHAFTDLEEPWQADFPAALLTMAKQFLQEETRLIGEDAGKAEGDDGGLMKLIDTSFLGWVVSFEAFRITSDDRDVERYARLRQIDRHPNRVEQRMVIFMGVESTLVVVTRDRGQSDDQVSVTVVDGKEQNVSGNVHQALRMLNMASILSILRRFGKDLRGPIFDLIRRQSDE